MKIAICASMAFAKEIMAVKKELENFGHTVNTPQNLLKFIDGSCAVEDKWEKIEGDVIRQYEKIIKKCDAILVLNYEKNKIKNYIGANTFLEIGFAHILKKKKYLLNPIPEKMMHTDEISSMKPTIISGDLTLLNNWCVVAIGKTKMGWGEITEETNSYIKIKHHDMSRNEQTWNPRFIIKRKTKDEAEKYFCS